jgi:hypothetical protein
MRNGFPLYNYNLFPFKIKFGMPKNLCRNGIFINVICLSIVLLPENLNSHSTIVNVVPVMRDLELVLNLKGNRGIAKWEGSLVRDFSRWLKWRGK